MIEPVSWHKDNLVDRRRSIKRMRVELDKLQSAVDESVRDYNILSAQLGLAKKEGEIGFDADTYGVNRPSFEWVD